MVGFWQWRIAAEGRKKKFSPKNQDGCPKHELSSIFFGGRGIGVCILGSFLGENRAPQGEFFHELHTPIVSHFSDRVLP